MYLPEGLENTPLKAIFVQNITLFSEEYIPNKDCCDIKPLTRTSSPFQRGSTDRFIGKNLKRCDNFQIPQLKSFKITNYSKSIFPDGWQGVYIEILFNNRSRWSTYVLLCIIWLLDYVIYHKLRKEQLLCKLRKFTK